MGRSDGRGHAASRIARTLITIQGHAGALSADEALFGRRRHCLGGSTPEVGLGKSGPGEHRTQLALWSSGSFGSHCAVYREPIQRLLCSETGQNPHRVKVVMVASGNSPDRLR